MAQRGNLWGFWSAYAILMDVFESRSFLEIEEETDESVGDSPEGR